MTPDTIHTLSPYADAKRYGRPVLWKVTPNNVHVIISPDGHMNNLVGREAADKFITNYIERNKDK